MTAKSPKTILIIGCGTLGRSLATRLSEQNHTVITVSRSPKALPNGITHICADIQTPNWTSALSTCTFDWVYVIVAPNEHTPMGYHRTYIGGIAPIVNGLSVLQNVVLVSSTRVYSSQNEQIAVIKDDSPLSPTDEFGKILQATELLWHAHFNDKLIIIRPSGLVDETAIFSKGRLYEMAKDPSNFNACLVNLTSYNTVCTVLSLLPDTPSDVRQNSYIINELSVQKSELLNAIARHHDLPTHAPKSTPPTGKNLCPTRYIALFDYHNINPKRLSL